MTIQEGFSGAPRLNKAGSVADSENSHPLLRLALRLPRQQVLLQQKIDFPHCVYCEMQSTYLLVKVVVEADLEQQVRPLR